MNKNQRPLKPEWLLKPCPLKTLHDEGLINFSKEVKENIKKANQFSNIKRKERLNYLFQIENEQGQDDLMWPYDLAKMMSSSKETLQMCRECDYLFDYIRENPEHEYDPKNYLVTYCPSYQDFKNFENDNGSDIDDFYDIN